MSLFVLVAVFATVAPAQAKMLGAIGTNVNYQLAANGRNYETRRPLSFRAGYRSQLGDIFGEYSYVSSVSGSGQVTIGSVNHEFLLWVRKSDPTAKWIKPFIAFGAGAHYETLSTRFGFQSQDETGALEILGATAAGVQIRIVKEVEITLEGRASFAESYSPNPLLGLGVYLSLLF